MTWTKSYSELVSLKTFDDRFDYLKLGGGVGQATFGFDRWMNQQFYTSHEWRRVRNQVILRDNGCDLGIFGYEIHVELLVHHMNPMTPDDVSSNASWILDPNFLITTCHRTHNAIHFGTPNPYPKVVMERSPGDTRLW